MAQLVSWPLAHPYWHASCLETEPGAKGLAPLPGAQQLWMDRKCLFSFQVSHGSLRNGHHGFLPLSLHRACDWMIFYLHYYLMASPSYPSQAFTVTGSLLHARHPCLRCGPFCLVTLPPHFCSLPLSSLCFSPPASHSAIWVCLLDPSI